jgi:HK97 family phage prohead protease
MSSQYDFCGWATRNHVLCTDGRTILKDAFKHNDGATVPLVWNHMHNDPENTLGHALLENRDEGVYAYCSFNDTPKGQVAKTLVQHGDIVALSIYANQLKENMNYVSHGNIREVSLVHAGANPEAFIDHIITHGDESDEEAIIYTGEELSLYHSDDKKEE